MKKINLKKEDLLKKRIKEVEERLGELDPETEEYSKAVKNRETLEQIRERRRLIKPPSGDTMLAVGANLAGMALVLKWEEAHVITSKAWQMVGRLVRR